MYPLSNFIPSITSSWSSKVFPSLTVITPSFPTYNNLKVTLKTHPRENMATKKWFKLELEPFRSGNSSYVNAEEILPIPCIEMAVSVALTKEINQYQIVWTISCKWIHHLLQFRWSILSQYLNPKWECFLPQFSLTMKNILRNCHGLYE